MILTNEQEEDESNKIINKFIGVIDKRLTNYWCECQRINKLEQRFCTFMGLEKEEFYPRYFDEIAGFEHFGRVIPGSKMPKLDTVEVLV